MMTMTSLTDRWYNPEYIFDEAAADRAVTFFERYLRHTKGRWMGCRFELMPWQRDEIIRPLFGWKRPDGTRRFRTAYIEIPRKNGKSSLCAGIALYLLLADREPGAEVISAAVDREQANIVFELAKDMVQLSPSLRRRTETYKRSITVPKTLSTYKVLSADSKKQHGMNIHGAVFDELHVWTDREQFSALMTGGGSRTQPLTVMITTAGYDRHSICWEQHEYARRVLEGIIEDDSFFAYIACADPEDDWTDPAVWKKANPGLGFTVSMDYLQQECKRAQEIPAYENTFKRLHLNIWTQQENRWMQMDKWDASAGEVDPEKLQGQVCYAGLDLSTTTDLTALALVFPMSDGTYQCLTHFWMPEDSLLEAKRRDKVPYAQWVQQGLITATPGAVIDYKFVQHQLGQYRERYLIKEVAFDRWGAAKLRQDLEEAGFTMVEFGQGFASMSPPTKELMNLILAKKLHHGGNPVLRWNADNVAVKIDPAGNIKPDKSKATGRIDGVVALIMALDRATRHQHITPAAEYADGDFLDRLWGM